MRRIIAIGGGGFLMESGRSLLDDYVVSLIDRARPRICFLNAGGGDPEEGLAKYYRAFRRFNARLSHLAFFRKPRTGSIPLLDVEPAQIHPAGRGRISIPYRPNPLHPRPGVQRGITRGRRTTPMYP